MDPLSVTASIIAILQLTSAVISYLDDIKDAPKDRAKCATEASNVFSLLTNLRYRLEDSDGDGAWFVAVRRLAVTNGPLDQYKAALEQLLPHTTPARGLKKVAHAMTWKFSKPEVESILLRIERLKSLTQIALEMDHFKLTQAIKAQSDFIRDRIISMKDDTAMILSGTTDIKDDTQTIKDSMTEQRKMIISNWLSQRNYAKQQDDFISRRQDGTGLWFLQSPEFTAWCNGTKQTLFTPGFAGTGKTIMAAAIVDHLFTSAYSDSVRIAYIYCNYKRQDEQKTVELLAILLKQLLHGKSTIPQPVEALYAHHSSRNTRPSLSELRKILKDVVKSFSRVYIIVDALDECRNDDGTRDALLSSLRDVQAGTDTRLLATSRPLPEVIQHFQDDDSLEVRASDADVEAYLRGHLSLLSKCVKDRPELQKQIVDDIVMVVDGMFLLAQLHLDSLKDKKNVKAVRVALEKLPSGSDAYDGAYKEAMERIVGQPQGERDLAKTVLAWISLAKRPLKAVELQHAIAIEPGEPALDTENLTDIEEILSVCAGLVTEDKQSNVIRLVHYTTQEYLERTHSTWLPNAISTLALACITYLSFDTFASGPCEINGVKTLNRIRQHPFLDYAVRYWDKHIGDAQEGTTNQYEKGLEDAAMRFLQCLELVRSCIQILWEQFHQSRWGSLPIYHWPPKGERATGIHLVATLRAPKLLKVLLSTDRNPDLSDGGPCGRTPLSYAAERGYEAVVQVLLETGEVDVDSKDKDGRTPLSYAANYGSEAVVRVLLGTGEINVDLKDKDGRTPLSYAANYGSEAVVRLLLETGEVDAVSKDIYGRTPISFAASHGKYAVVQLLLEIGGVDADPKDSWSRTSLSYAAKSGYEAIVRLLLETGEVDTDSKDISGITPLSYAARNSHKAVVRVLLETGKVDPNSKDILGGTPLLYAAIFGPEAVVRLLLETGKVDINSKDNNGRTPLWWAASFAHEAIVRLLLETGKVDANSADIWGKTPLSCALEGGHSEIVALLESYTRTS
ncbi:hypothetical protein LTR66_002248 [Elasticomyces elasticus]|nr:hypothetical protein LTR66_002248 [Elasticomyces elasticus]KAK5009785.1 hypothetical protein LTR28_013421 [Elasticomyces elasticus]